jgi:hypothetical protein
MPKPQYAKRYLADGREVQVLVKIPWNRRPERYESKVEQALDDLYKTDKHNAPQFGVSMSLWPTLQFETFAVSTKPSTYHWTVGVLRVKPNELLMEKPE